MTIISKRSILFQTSQMSYSPTSAQLLSSSADSMSIDASESPNQADLDRQHYKVYRFLDQSKMKYVGRCWSVDARSAALKLGTRGLPRVDCTTQVLVEECQEAGELHNVIRYKFKIRQVFGEITPLIEAKYSDKSKLSSDGRMKYKEILEEQVLTTEEVAKLSKSPATPQRSPAKAVSPVQQAERGAEFMMVPVLTQVPSTLGFSNPWSLPSLFQPNSEGPAQPLKKPVLFQQKRFTPSVKHSSVIQRPPVQQQTRWSLNPTQRYAVSK
jgi:hypothetical protein